MQYRRIRSWSEFSKAQNLRNGSRLAKNWKNIVISELHQNADKGIDSIKLRFINYLAPDIDKT